MFLILCDCVVAHDPASKFAFRDEADAITDALTDLGINLYHIGQHRDSGHFAKRHASMFSSNCSLSSFEITFRDRPNATRFRMQINTSARTAATGLFVDPKAVSRVPGAQRCCSGDPISFFTRRRRRVRI